MATPVLTLLKTVCESILQVILQCFAGWYLCKVGILEKSHIHNLNNLNLSLFTPALMISKLAFSLSPSQLQELWIIPLFFILLTGMSLVTTRLLSAIFKLPKMQSNFADAASMFMNCNSLPVALMQSMVETMPQLRAGDDDGDSVVLGRSLSYLFLFAVFSNILRWSYGLKLLEGNADAEVPNLRNRSRTVSSSSYDSDTRVGSDVLIDTSVSAEGPSYTLAADSVLVVKGNQEPTSSKMRLIAKLKTFYHNITQVMTPPLAMSILSLIIAVIPPLQSFLEDYTPALKMAIKDAGQCSIPLTLVVLGAYFYTPEDPYKDIGPLIHVEDCDSESSLLELRVGSPTIVTRLRDFFSLSDESKTILAVILSRMFLVPVLVIPLIYLSTITSWHNAFEDPAFTISIVLLASSPPALTLAQIASKSSGDAFERLISRTLFWSYCIFTPPTVILYVSLGLWISRVD